jgi:hypothetical protein
VNAKTRARNGDNDARARKKAKLLSLSAPATTGTSGFETFDPRF